MPWWILRWSSSFGRREARAELRPCRQTPCQLLNSCSRPQRLHRLPIDLEAEARRFRQLHAAAAAGCAAVKDAMVDWMIAVVTRRLRAERGVAECGDKVRL